MTYPKRLIEVDLPIARISSHARREKSIRHGHISTLHIWWARRPLAACRAVTCAALWPDPADPLCPPRFRHAASELITRFARRVFPERITEESRQLQSEKHLSPEGRARWEAVASGTLTLDPEDDADWFMLRMCLLDFIADFANWDNSTVPAYLETSRALTQAAHEALGGVPGTRPLVVDPFAGGGSIPLEALRVGADAFASDLNPVAVLLNKVVLEYIPKYGNAEIRMKDADGNDIRFHGLAEAVRYWGNWVKEQAEKELAQFYPKDPDGSTPIAYIWARTVLSEAPADGEPPVEIPLIRSMWLSKRGVRYAMRWATDDSGVVYDTEIVHYVNGEKRTVRRPRIEVFCPSRESEVPNGTVARGTATCPVTGHSTPVAAVKNQLRDRCGGAWDARLLAVACTRDSERGRYFRAARQSDSVYSRNAAEALELLDTRECVPNEPLPPPGGLGFRVQPYGVSSWSQLFLRRQLLTLVTISRFVEECARVVRNADEGFADALQVCLAMALGRQVDHNATGCTWNPSGPKVQHTFTRQALPMTWDFAEAAPFGDSVGDWLHAIDCVLLALANASHFATTGAVQQASARSHPLPDDSSNLFMTDPPYYDAVPYADLSDFVFVWLRRVLPSSLRSLSQQPLTPKDEECIVDPLRGKDRAFFESCMAAAMAEGRRELTPSGVGVVVFAHKSTDGWEAMLQAMIDGGLTITGSWPIDTEMATRLRAIDSAALASSVHLVCRPRENPDGSLREDVGEWRDVLTELPRRIHEWMPRLAAEGVVGADAIFACLGPALEIFSRYSRVEKASGEAVPLREYLEQVWAAVSTEALSMIFRDADAAGLEPDARLTAMWLWTLGAGGENGGGGSGEKVVASTGYTLEFDAARKIAQGLGIHLEKSESIVEVKGDKARLLPVSERTRFLFGREDALAATARGRKKPKKKQRSLFEELEALEAETDRGDAGDLQAAPGETVLDRVHQAMILFAAGRGEALRRFLVDDGAGTDARFWKLAQSLSALYPRETDEKRWVDGVLARKKGLGL